MLYDSNYVTFWKSLNYGDSKKISDCVGLGARLRKGRMNNPSTVDFQSTETTLHYIITMETCHYYFSKPMKCITATVNFNVNYGLWVILICHCKSISCNKCTTPGGNVDIEGGYECMEVGRIWKSFVSSF